MSEQKRGLCLSSMVAKRQASDNNVPRQQVAKKRPPLSNITNHKSGSSKGPVFGSAKVVPGANKNANSMKVVFSSGVKNTGFSKSTFPTASTVKPNLPTASSVKPNLTTASSIKPNLTTASSVKPNLTTASSVKPNLPTASSVKPNLTTASSIKPNLTTASSVKLNLTIDSSVKPNLTTASSVKPNLTTASSVKPNFPIANKKSVLSKGNEKRSISIPQISIDISPPHSDSGSVSMDESMSTCDSLNSPDVEYIDNSNVAALDSLERKTCSKLFISEPEAVAEILCKRGKVSGAITTEEISELDDNFLDPQLCATLACDIYNHLRASEVKKRPSANFMETVQKDINASMRAILVDWLVEVSEEYRLVPDTLYLTINYIDRYLSGNTMDRQKLQLLGVACMMIASKYEEICAPQVEEFCYITDNTYFREEVLEMESKVLNFLKFEMTAPTVKCFLRRFVRAALAVDEAPPMQLECLSNYIAELSLIEYNMLCYAPSLIAASAIFLANYSLFPSKKPWNPTLRHYTLYKPFELRDCVQALHSLCCNNNNSSLPAIREKYSQHKYKFVAVKYCPSPIPLEYFEL